MVRRIGRGLGGSSRGRGYFRLLVSRRVGSVDQHQRALGHRKSSSLLRSVDPGRAISHFCRQFHRDWLHSEPGGHKIPAVECHRLADSSVVGASSSGSGSTVHHGLSQRVCGFSFASESSVRFGMDPQDRGLPGAPEEVAGVLRPLCHLTQSPMLSIFFSVLRSERSGHGCSAPELEWVAGVCLSTLVAHSGGAQEAPVVLWSPSDNHSSVLASMSLVSGPPGSGCRWSGGSASVERSLAPATLPSSSSGSVRAVASCLETIQ